MSTVASSTPSLAFNTHLSTMSPGRHPLSDVVQSIHLEHPSPQGLSRFIVSTFPSPAVGEPIIVLYGSGRRGELYVWSSKPGKHKVGVIINPVFRPYRKGITLMTARREMGASGRSGERRVSASRLYAKWGRIRRGGVGRYRGESRAAPSLKMIGFKG